MTGWVVAGPLLMLAMLCFLIPAWIKLSGHDHEAQERERLRKAALRESLRQGMDRAWINGPVMRRKANRHDRAHGRRRGYTEGM